MAADAITAPSVRAGGTATKPSRRRNDRPLGYNPRLALLFLLPALVLLGALVVYPIIYTIVRSFYDRAGDFTGIDNYREMIESERTLRAIRNNAIWVVTAPTLAAGIGLIFAVLSERIRWQAAFKIAVFIPMAISFLAAGVIFRIVYDENPDTGLANAVATTVVDTFDAPGEYPTARPADVQELRERDGGYVTRSSFSPGDTVGIGMVAIRPDRLPSDARRARAPTADPNALNGTVWLDFTRGGGGTRGTVDETERGLPSMEVEAVRAGETGASTTTDGTGRFSFDELQDGSYRVRLASSNFEAPYGGVSWLGPALVTPAIIAAFLWIWIGFAMIIIAAGLAAIPRDVLEAARTEGASEWQVFRKVTAPLLFPVLLVVVVTLMINVLRIFDLVFVIAPASVQDDANVIALEMWRVSFGGALDHGLGSALSVLLFLLVIPAMAFNIRRFRLEQSS